MKRRILSILLSLCMVVTLLPVTAFADELSDKTTIESVITADSTEETADTTDTVTDLTVETADTADTVTDPTEETADTTDTVTDPTEDTADTTDDAVVSNEDSVDTSDVIKDIADKSVDGSPELREEWLKMKAEQKSDEGFGGASMYSLMGAADSAPSTLQVGQDPKQDDITRYTVLVLDVSGSMYGTPIYTMRSAATKFCEKVLQADGNNYVAIVTYDSYSNTICQFTDDYATLANAINGIIDLNMTNTNSGLITADSLLSTIPDAQGTVKNILLLSDGMPNSGSYNYSGHYTYNDYYYYQYANTTYDTAKQLHAKGYYLYTLGFFHSLYDEDLVFARKFMNDLQNAGYYDVVNADDLEFVFGEIAKDILKKSGTFRYQSGTSDWDATYYYDDSYFFDNAYSYDESLATMSLCLAMSAFATSEDVPYTQKSANALNLLEQIGFTGFTTNNWYTVKPTMDSIGAVAANKEIDVNGKAYTLIAVAVRGGGYESEWASNFTIGATGQHQGFDEAKENVLEFITEYISDQGITGDIKIWLTGYSRAAATSNLVAGAIDDGVTFGNCTLTLSDLYAYCFETPAGAIAADANTNPVYKNIFNIINYNDPVTKVAPAALGFRRYGVDKRLPDPVLDKNYIQKRDKMITQYTALPSTTGYIIDNFSMKKIAIDVDFFPSLSITPTIEDDTKNQMIQGAFLDTFITKMVKEQIKSRSNYVSKYQDGVRELFGVMNGTEDAQWADFKERFENKLKSNIGWLIVSTTPAGQLFVGSTAELIEEYAVESLNEANITQYDADQINKLAQTLAGTIIEFAVSHPNLTTTLICNIEGMGAAHFPELCLAWLQSMDKNYTTSAGESFSNGAYRIIHINCPVDVEVYDSTDNLVAAITADVPQEVEGSSIITALNEDGEKLVYLPADADFNLRLTATGAGQMTFSINEFSCDIGDIARIINFYDIPLQLGNTFTSMIPAYSAEDLSNGTGSGSTTAYTLLDSGNAPILPSVDLMGNDAAQAYYMVSASASDNNFGYVTGQGIRQLGNYAMVTAVAYQGYDFKGWYNGDELLSTDAMYRFCVLSDVNLTALFTKGTGPYALISVINPSPISGLTNGTAKTATALGLPTSVSINTAGGRMNAGVTWDVNSTTYNPSSGNAQTFTVSGSVTLPADVVNTANISLTTTIQVTVNAAANTGGGISIPTTNLIVPRIKNSDIMGWDNITKSLTDNLREVSIIMNSSTVVPKKLLETIRDKDVKVTFILENEFEWIINGKDIPKESETFKLGDTDISASAMKASTTYDQFKALSGVELLQMNLSDQGGFGFEAVLRIPLKNQKGKIANLFYDNNADKLLELVTTGKVNDNGYVDLKLNSFHDYLVAVNDSIILDDAVKAITVVDKNTLYIGGTTGKSMILKPVLPKAIEEAITNGYCNVSVTYHSSDYKIAAVNSKGKVFANKSGTATITTTVTVNGVQVSLKTVITVKKAYIKITQSTDSMMVGDTFTFKVEGYGVDVKDITFKTSKRSIVVINKTTGEATAVSAGTDYVVIKAGNIKVVRKVVVE